MVAIKKISAFDHHIVSRRKLRELKLLRILKHENVVKIRTIILPKSRADFQDIYIVFELMDTDLGSFLRTDEQLTDTHHKFFLYQILLGLKCIHSANAVHRNLQPRKLLINENCDLKICELGEARLIFEKEWMLDHLYTTKWYKAP